MLTWLWFTFLGISRLVIVRFEKFKNTDPQWSKLYTLIRVARRYLRASAAKGLTLQHWLLILYEKYILPESYLYFLYGARLGFYYSTQFFLTSSDILASSLDIWLKLTGALHQATFILLHILWILHYQGRHVVGCWIAVLPPLGGLKHFCSRCLM